MGERFLQGEAYGVLLQVGKRNGDRVTTLLTVITQLQESFDLAQLIRCQFAFQAGSSHIGVWSDSARLLDQFA